MRASLILLLSLFLLGGCQNTARTPVVASHTPVRTTLQIHRGVDGGRIAWGMMIDSLAEADVIVVGEQHDDATGHAAQLALVEDLFVDGHGCLAMEMLERDEQALIDDYRDGLIDAEFFAQETGSTDWSGTDSWAVWYQPIIDAAMSKQINVIAANAPRRYVRLARTHGWEKLDALDASRRMLVDHPHAPITGPYRDRFMEFMIGSDDGSNPERRAEELATAELFFQSQQVWDATMAGSVSTALAESGPPVILLVGRFHSDDNGGTVQELRHLLPAAKIRTISLEPDCHTVKFDQSSPKADFIVCTGDDQSH